VFVEVYIDPKTGSMVMAGQDLGAAPRQFFDKDEYEYFLSVKATLKDQLLLHLMQQVFGGQENTRTAIAAWLDERQIPYELASF
jgi:hypothetical protein